MVNYDGIERRMNNLNLDGRLQVAEDQIINLKENKDCLIIADKELTEKINILNIQIPRLTDSIKSLTTRIDNHEANAEIRSLATTEHKLKCGETAVKATIGLWLIGIIFALIGVLFKIK